MNIVCCTDHNYIMPTGVMICSACINHSDSKITFYVVCNSDVTENDKKDLKDITYKYQHGIEFVSAPIITKETECFTLNKEGQPKHVTIDSYYRLFLAEILPETVNKILYLDGDIIVRHSLVDMYKISLDNFAIAAVADMDEGAIQKFNNLRYEQSLGHFNAGVLLINLEYWRTHHLLQNFIDFATEYPERIKFHDQDILNYVLRESKQSLHLKYNVQDGFFKKVPNISWKYERELKEAINDPFIVHFTCGGANKPWYKGCEVPYKEEFIRYRNLTKWKDMPLQGISLPVKSRIKQFVKKMLIAMGIITKPENKYILIESKK